MSHYKKIDTTQLKAMIDPVEFYTAEGQDITTKGASPWKLAGLCPFHNDEHKGSFHIHDISGSYHCFSCEAIGGDIISFTQMKYGLSFVDAMRKLAQEWRVL